MNKKVTNIIGNIQKRHIIVIFSTILLFSSVIIFISHEFLKIFSLISGDIITLVLTSGLDLSLMIDMYLLIISGYFIYFNKFLSGKFSYLYYFFRQNNPEK